MKLFQDFDKLGQQIGKQRIEFILIVHQKVAGATLTKMVLHLTVGLLLRWLKE
jgi:hypothetical protein